MLFFLLSSSLRLSSVRGITCTVRTFLNISSMRLSLVFLALLYLFPSLRVSHTFLILFTPSEGPSQWRTFCFFPQWSAQRTPCRLLRSFRRKNKINYSKCSSGRVSWTTLLALWCIKSLLGFIIYLHQHRWSRILSFYFSQAVFLGL